MSHWQNQSRFVQVKSKEKLNFDQFSNRVLRHPKKRIYFLGERHGQSQITQMQFAIAKRLCEKNKIAIMMEHFSTEQRNLLDRVSFMKEAAFIAEYDDLGDEGHDLTPYMPLLRWAKAETEVSLSGCFPPRRFAKKMVKEGVESALEAVLEAGILPTRDKFIAGSDAHYRRFEALITGEKKATGVFKNIFPAQVLKDSVAAHLIDQRIRSSPDENIVAIIGNGHCEFGHGIPERVNSDRLILVSREVDEDFEDEIADFIFLYEAD